MRRDRERQELRDKEAQARARAKLTPEKIALLSRQKYDACLGYEAQRTLSKSSGRR